MKRQTQVLDVAAITGFPDSVLADLRTDHAGETGAVCIYRGVLQFARDPKLRAFAVRHLQTEQIHLERIEALLEDIHRSQLLPLWRLAGWVVGAVPSLFGPRAVYATIATVETFVDHHYALQVERLAAEPQLHALRQTLEACRSDEVEHRDEAAAAFGRGAPSLILKGWCWLVDTGSRAAVAVSRHI